MGPLWYRAGGTGTNWTAFNGATMECGAAGCADTLWVDAATFVLGTPDMTSTSKAKAGDFFPVKGDHQVPEVLATYPMPYSDGTKAGVVSPIGPDFGEQEWFDRWGEKAKAPNFACRAADDVEEAVAPAPGPWPMMCPSGEPVLNAEHIWWHSKTGGASTENIEWFYNEITVEDVAPYTYYMATGFAGGYMGIQHHNSESERYAIFSVWDQATSATIEDSGDDVVVARFGMEGTGVHSHVLFPWKVNETVRFLVHSAVEDTGFTTITGYVQWPGKQMWKMLASIRVKPCGFGAYSPQPGHLQGFNSFLEIWNVADCHSKRSARWGPAFYKVKNNTGWDEFPVAGVNSTCFGRCPTPNGINYQAPAGSYVRMEVGAEVKNEWGVWDWQKNDDFLVRMQNMSAPTVLTTGAMPWRDFSPAGEAMNEELPLRPFGSHNKLRVFGSRSNGFIPCPWYVADCEGAKHE